MRKILVFWIVLVLFASCQNKNAEFGSDQGYDEVIAEDVEITRQEAPPLPPLEAEKIAEKKLIKDGNLTIEVAKIAQAKVLLDSLVKQYQGYFSDESYGDNDNQHSFNCSVRIPATRFEDFIFAIEKGEGKVVNKRLETRDVTTQFIDMETRLENKQRYLARYQELLKKANSIKEILEIEDKIRILEEELESTKGRLRYLNSQVNYSTLRVTFFSKKAYKYTPNGQGNFFERLKQSVAKGWFGFVSFVLMLVRIWPFWILIFVIFIILRKIRKNCKKKKDLLL